MSDRKTVFARARIVGALFVSGVLAWTAPAFGQCVGSDQLELGACCQQLPANVPAFPPAALPGLGICWDNCIVTGQNPLKVAWSMPVPVTCGQYASTLTVSDAGSGLVVLSGVLVLDYTRTWMEIDASGAPVQVWRFVAKADLSWVPSPAAPTCPVPSCLPPFGPHPTAFFYGYVDYASLCGTTLFENALVLFHGCDFFMHKPGLSDFPGAFHPGRSYGIVAPHSTAQPFMPANLPAPGGALVAEAVRNVNNVAGGGLCIAEDKVVGGVLAPLANGCLCPFAVAPAQVTIRYFAGSGTCVDSSGLSSSWVSLLIAFPTIPWPYLVTTSIGVWTMPTVYPGMEMAWVDEGLFSYHDPCTAKDYFEVYYGASTSQGWPVFPTTTGSVLTQNFTDVADNWSATAGGPYIFPMLGSIRQTDHLIYVNVP